VHERFAGRRAIVMGLGAFGGGLGATRYLYRLGARVLVTDQRDARDLAAALAGLDGMDVELALGGHRERDFESAELVVANPAVPPASPYLAIARRAGALITSEMELFLESCRSRLVLITGTQGKSSTTHMCADLLRHFGARVHLGGNIGRSLLDSLEHMQATDVAVVEVSSYQLESLSSRRVLEGVADAVAIVNVLADHLERHGSIEAYLSAKLRLFELVAPGGVAVVPGADARLAAHPLTRGRRILFWPMEGAPADAMRGDACVAGGEFRLGRECLGRAADLAVPGGFQKENALVALVLSRALGAEPAALAGAVSKLKGLEHRMEDLGMRRGRRVIDNGVSTTPDSTLSALREMARPCVLLAGGKAKNLPLGDLVEVARAKVRLLVSFGESAERLRAAFAAAGVSACSVATVEAAVAAAFDRAREGEEILFSPACASFDAYGNFAERVRAFRGALPPPDPD
jgi:UDP-N-acetylmuramoylalanine--D-glutamate ligase